MEWPAGAPAQESRSEWVDGDAIVFTTTSVRHANIAGSLCTLLLHDAQFFRLGRGFVEPVELRLGQASRLPNINSQAADHIDRLEEMRLIGAADPVVEVVSNDSVERDTVDKFAEYLAAAGMPEYWLVDARAG